jgi:hypothetical protein
VDVEGYVRLCHDVVCNGTTVRPTEEIQMKFM